MDKLNAMNLYCHIVESGQLSIAADNLNLSKGAVSKQLAKLEAHLGGRLLNRTTRRLTPTEAGIAFYERAKQILESVKEAECVVTGLTTEPHGTLKINAPMSFGGHYLGELLAKYQQKYPKMKIDLTLHDRQVDFVEEGYDLALRIATLKDSTLIVRKLATCHIVICASPDYLQKNGRPKTPSDLKNHQCLLYAYSDSVKNWRFENKEGEKQQVLLKGSLYANNGNLICDALINGMGIARLPTFIVGDAIRKGTAEVILDDWRPPALDISLLYPSNRHLSAKVRAFVDLAVEHFRPLAGEVNQWDRDLFTQILT
ncbi:Transcriptional regulator, LysR family [hydrothermal vent metagenome]|uniref:Transcriptional regulator, LysR family n=1 Tax=hydrothermal vent metagenome TaxID=652676 RepID=A0A3B0W4U1_9ZZZZ